jgi:hypothetical protein
MPEQVVWEIDGSIEGHAGAHITFTLGPYIGTIDENEMSAILIGLGELLATQGQYVRHARVTPAIYFGPRTLDEALRALKAVEPDVAREQTEAYWGHCAELMRAEVQRAEAEVAE